MNKLDYDKYDVVGIVTKMGTTQNAQINCIGLSDRQTGLFIPVQSFDRNKIFPTRGCVFAYDYLKYNPDWENECVCLSVKPNSNQKIVNGEDYVWDWNGETYIYADRLKELDTHIGEDGGENYDNLLKEGILPCKKIQYFTSPDVIYRIDPDVRLISYWKLSKVKSCIVTYNGIDYLIDGIYLPEDGKIDITSDSQLIEWYKKNILRKEWNTIYASKDFTSVDELVSSELQKLRIPTNIFRSRLERILHLSTNINLTFEELEDLSTSPWFADTVLNAMEKFADQYVKKVKEKYREEISSLEIEHKHALEELGTKFDQEKETLLYKIDDKQKELIKIEENIQEEKKRLESLRVEIENRNRIIHEINSRKESIIADFSVIREVLSTSSQKTVTMANQSTAIIDYDKKDERGFSTAGPFKRNIESLLMKYNAMKIPADEIITKIATNNVVLFPDNITLLATIQATRRCRYLVSYVSVEWKSFNDLWESGLSTILNEAVNNPEIIHFLVLRNINMSYIPCYLQPILDMGMELTNFFPGTTIEFPENMRIFCTRTKDNVIPISESSLVGIGCISTYDDRYTGNGSIAEGFLPLSVFSDLPVDEKYISTSNYDSYIDE